MDRPYRDRDWLEEKYHGEGLTQREIGEICDVSPTTIRKQMQKFGIETREVKGENHGMFGKERSEEVKQRISEKLKDRKFSEETRKKISESLTGKTIPPEVRAEISKSLRGVEKSDKTRERMSESKLHPIPPDRLEERKWTTIGYGRGFAHARTTVRKRDEVCQFCGEDGSRSSLVVHHIIPVRLVVQSPQLRFRDAHRTGNLILVCRSCHPQVEWGDIDVEPDFENIPTELHGEFQRLWEMYIEWKHSISNPSISEE